MRRLALFLLKLGVTGSLLYLALSRANTGMLVERVGRLDLAWIAAGVGIALLQTVPSGWRWAMLANRCGASLPFGDAVRFSLVGTFFNQVLPSTIGGDAARVLLLARSGAGWRAATYSVLLDRFAGVFVLAILVSGLLPWSLALIPQSLARWALLAVGVGSLAGALLFLSLASLHWPWLARWSAFRHLIEMSRLAQGILRSPHDAARLLGVSIFIHMMSASIVWSAAKAIAAPIEFVHVLLLGLPTMLITTIPISVAGWGVRETAFLFAFSFVGVPEDSGVLVSLLYGSILFILGAIGSLAWFFEPRRAALSAGVPQQ